jgi:isopentenyldiphosphate isomerase
VAIRARTNGRTPASRRLAADLGLVVEPDDLVDAGTVMDEIADRASRLLEREYDNLSAGRVTDHPQLNEAEVAEITAVSLAGLTSVTLDGSRFTAWLPIVRRAAIPALSSLATP